QNRTESRLGAVVVRCALIAVLGGSLFAGLLFGQEQSASPQTTGEATSSQSARTREINDLKATLTQIQERLKRLENDWPPEITGLPFLKAPPEVDPSVSAPTTERMENQEGMFNVEWKNGMWISTKEDEFRVHAGGNLQFDYGWNRASQAVQFGPGGIG